MVKTPKWVKKVFRNRIWEMAASGNELFLSFDDGPHPEYTLFVLDELKKYNAKATFFCIGKNVAAFPGIYRRIIEEGHAVGNHTFNHLNGMKSTDAAYLENIKMAKEYIDSNLFRPPYGKITPFLVKQLMQPLYKLTTIMWTVLSGDFDLKISKEQCLENVLLNAGKGSIIVFHDSEKASERMQYALPKVLEYFSAKGFEFKKITL
jgi:peptidoglycan/xylan/chitin deacetylase (PgdA/CDA1 family)